MYFIRQKHNVKPQMWGPPNQVAWAVRDYYENRLGVAAPESYLPLWENAGSRPINYGKDNFLSSLQFYGPNSKYENNYVNLPTSANNSQNNYIGATRAGVDTTALTILCVFRIDGYPSAYYGMFGEAITNTHTGLGLLITQTDTKAIIKTSTSYTYSSDSLSVDLGKWYSIAFTGHESSRETFFAVLYSLSDNVTTTYSYVATSNATLTNGTLNHTYLRLGSNGHYYNYYDFQAYCSLYSRINGYTPLSSLVRAAQEPYAAIQPRSFPSYFFVTTGGAGVTGSPILMMDHFNGGFLNG